MVDAAGYAGAFTFKYSPRPGTPAAGIADQVPEEAKDERLYRLQAKIDARQAAFMRAQVGTTADVLFERPGKRPGQVVGRSPWLMPVHVDGPVDLVGTIARVRFTETHGNSLFGALAAPAALAAPSAVLEAAL